jgi:hypothetical protein
MITVSTAESTLIVTNPRFGDVSMMIKSKSFLISESFSLRTSEENGSPESSISACACRILDGTSAGLPSMIRSRRDFPLRSAK